MDKCTEARKKDQFLPILSISILQFDAHECCVRDGILICLKKMEGVGIFFVLWYLSNVNVKIFLNKASYVLGFLVL